jgi:hypothetical protein
MFRAHERRLLQGSAKALACLDDPSSRWRPFAVRKMVRFALHKLPNTHVLWRWPEISNLWLRRVEQENLLQEVFGSTQDM